MLFFVTTSCPISNRYTPEMNHLIEQYLTKGVAFFVVQVEPQFQPCFCHHEVAQWTYRD